MQIPQSYILTTKYLNRVFDKTVATYKYYWFISILEIYVGTGTSRIKLWDIIISMIANAWYPVHYFRLSFGKSDSMYVAVKQLQVLTGIPIDASKKEVMDTLRKELHRKEIRSLLRVFTLNVPFRFLRPWIDTSDDKQVVERSQTFENVCLYALKKEQNEWWVEINPAWSDYLKENYRILMDFAYWNLTLFLQTRNPNVPNIPNKLIKPECRDSLTKQRAFWNTVIQTNGQLTCIYTGRELYVGNYDLDHFIPWSFVSHDLLWNLLPADPSINSSKGNKLPLLDVYLPKLASAHHEALRVYITLNKNRTVLEDYLSLGYTPNDLVSMNDSYFCEVFYQTFSPMVQIALNMGFESWNYTSNYE